MEMQVLTTIKLFMKHYEIWSTIIINTCHSFIWKVFKILKIQEPLKLHHFVLIERVFVTLFFHLVTSHFIGGHFKTLNQYYKFWFLKKHICTKLLFLFKKPFMKDYPKRKKKKSVSLDFGRPPIARLFWMC